MARRTIWNMELEMSSIYLSLVSTYVVIRSSRFVVKRAIPVALTVESIANVLLYKLFASLCGNLCQLIDGPPNSQTSNQMNFLIKHEEVVFVCVYFLFITLPVYLMTMHNNLQIRKRFYNSSHYKSWTEHRR